MKRRSFLKSSALAAAPILINGIPVSGAPNTGSSMLDALAESAIGCGKILVIIQMNGGNDGLNTVFPIDKYGQLQAARPNIIMDQSQIAPLNGNSTTGLHPAMAEMKGLYDAGKMMIVQGVSYPNPSFSHFRATDIWFSASDSNTTLDTGWLGRGLDAQYPNFPAAYPNPEMTDPLAIQIGSTLPFSLQGPGINMGYNVTSPNALLNVINSITDPVPNNDYGRELSFLRLMKDQSNAYRTVIQNAYNTTQQQSATYPTGNSLGDQLKIVAKLINGGLKTPVYVVNHPNTHDLHENQVNQTDRATGTHANILGILSKAIGAFQADLELMGKAQYVAGMTFSEFGRRIRSNASNGTDHGTAAPVMFFGTGLNTSPADVAGTAHPVPGMVGVSPTFPGTIDNNTLVPLQFDFRQLYASIMEDWLCLTPSQTNAVLGANFTRLPIFKPLQLVPLTGIELKGQYTLGEAVLSYTVQENYKYEMFTVQFSGDGFTFTDLSSAANNSSNATETYLHRDTNRAPKMYYRIMAKDRQGQKLYSNIILLKATRQQWLSIYPNPVENQTVHIKFYEAQSSQVEVHIYSIAGAKIYSNTFNNISRDLTFKVPHVISNSHYILEVVAGSEIVREQIMFR